MAQSLSLVVKERQEDSPLQSFDITLPLVVDLDGTLVMCDTLGEAFVTALHHHPFSAFMALFVLLRHGRASFKRRISTLAALDAWHLPYRTYVLDIIAVERRRGRRIILATGADEKIALAVASCLRCFDERYQYRQYW